MREHDTSTDNRPSLKPRNGLLVLDGYGIRISVQRRHLVVEDGIASERRAGRLSRATCRLKRLVVLGHTGFVTLEALRWMFDLGVAFIQIDHDGNVIIASGRRGLDNARLRRAQAIATADGTAMSIARYLVNLKLEKQRALAQRFAPYAGGIEMISRLIDKVAPATTAEELRIIEARVADLYWDLWRSLPVLFLRRDMDAVPSQWTSFGSRTSPITGRARLAANPANAILNYLYALAEAESSIALLAMGLDPGLGVYHMDQEARDSLACDVMEAVRPDADAYLLDLISQRTFAAHEFFETRNGVCRVMPPLTKTLMGAAPHFARTVAPIVEQIAKMLTASPGRKTSLPTPLTQVNRAVGRWHEQWRGAAVSKSRPQKLCIQCGASLRGKALRYCATCVKARKRELEEDSSRGGTVSAKALNEALESLGTTHKAATGVVAADMGSVFGNRGS
jgi:CRISPR-associated endonuclease Cas1